MSALDHARLTEVALGVAQEAAQRVLSGYRKQHSVSEKGAHDLVTECDLESEALIRRRLAAETPGIALVAEEKGGRAEGRATWYCDPLDGTTNFVHGHPFWSVSIGLLEAGVPTAGAVVAPSLGLWWTGYRGGQAQRAGETCQVSRTDSLDSALLAGFPPRRDQEPDSNLATFSHVMRQVRGVRRCGSAAIDLCLVADGTYDAYWERSLNAWDLTGGAAVVLSAGGRLSSLSGGPAELRRGHVIASNGLLHEAIVELLSGHL